MKILPHKLALALAACVALAQVTTAGVGETNSGSVSSEVTTEPTGLDGVRYSAESGWTVFTVPTHCVINKDLTKVNVLTAAGSEHNPTVEYADYVEVVPGTGVMSPRTIRVKTFARGPRGHAAGRGWLKNRVDFTYVQVK